MRRLIYGLSVFTMLLGACTTGADEDQSDGEWQQVLEDCTAANVDAWEARYGLSEGDMPDATWKGIRHACRTFANEQVGDAPQ